MFNNGGLGEDGKSLRSPETRTSRTLSLPGVVGSAESLVLRVSVFLWDANKTESRNL